MEHWKSIDGYDGYEVSSFGRVRSLRLGKTRILTPCHVGSGGYLAVMLCKDGIRKNLLVHRLVANAFIQNPQNLKTVNHIDENKLNNSAANLEWLSMKDNNNYGTRNKRIAKSNINNLKLSKQVQMLDKKTGELLATFPSAHEAERLTGIAVSNICYCCRGERNSAGGYVWKYA